jgi:hypothetical protein
VVGLTEHLTRHPKNRTVPELAGKVPSKDVIAFVNKYPMFFDLVSSGKTTRVFIKQHVSKTGYQWRMCADYFFTNKCTRDHACNFWHGPNDQRDNPQHQAGGEEATGTTSAGSSRFDFNAPSTSQPSASTTPTPANNPSQSRPAVQPAKPVQTNKQPVSKPTPPKVNASKSATGPKLSKKQRYKANKKARLEEEKKNQPQPVLPKQNVKVAPVVRNVTPAPMTVPKPSVPAVTVPKRKFEGKNCYLVPKEKKCGEILSELMNQEVIAIDCEGVNHGPNGKLCLIQIATSLNIYVIDVCVIKKILHDARNDNEALYSVGIINEHFEDTQILHGLLTSLRGKPEKKIGLKELMQHYGFNHELKTTMKANYKSDPALWAKRPLTEDMIEYAACDVANLTTVYKKLKEDIETEMMLISRNYAMPKELKLMEKTYVDAIKIQLDVKLRLFFTPEKKPDRRNLEDVFLEGKSI